MYRLVGSRTVGAVMARRQMNANGWRRYLSVTQKDSDWEGMSEAEIAAAKDKIFEEVLREDMSTKDLRGMSVVAKVAGRENGDTIYEFGHKHTLRTPKPLHLSHASSQGTAARAGSIREATENIRQEGEEYRSKEGVNEEVVLRVKESDLLLYSGELLPDFDNPPPCEEEAGEDDPNLMSWKMLNFAMESRRPLRARILNTINGGFSVGIGAVVGFLPNSHLSPFLKGPTSKHWEHTVEAVLGEQLWVTVLSCDRKLRNVVVSHRTVPRPYIMPQISQAPQRGNARLIRRSPPQQPQNGSPIRENIPAASGAPKTD